MAGRHERFEVRRCRSRFRKLRGFARRSDFGNADDRFIDVVRLGMLGKKHVCRLTHLFDVARSDRRGMIAP